MEKQILKHRLTPSDFVILKRVVNWNKFSRLKEELIHRIILIMGGVFLVVSLYNTINFHSDKKILFVTLPGMITGFLFIWLYRSGMNRIKEKKKLAVIIEKILDKVD